MGNVILKNIKKKYGATTVVENLSLEVIDGEFIVLVGPSGCGKSTTLRMIAGLEDISEGTLMIGDKEVNDLPPHKRKIAMVFQNYALYPHKTVKDNIIFGLKKEKAPPELIKSRLEKVTDILQLEPYLDRKPADLSGGQRQRVAMGRALVRDPEVFLFDEPLSNLDAKLRVQTRKEITKLHQRLNTTFIYVTHDQVEAMTMGSKIAVINHGILQQLDTPQKLYSEPANMFVAGFIGSPAMNFFQAKIEKSGGNLIINTDDFIVAVPKEKTDVYTEYVGKDIIFGIRPEDIYNPKYPVSGIKAAPVQCKVDLRELMGDEIYIYLMAGKKDLVARVDPRSEFKVGEKVEVVFDMTNFHIFDPKINPDNPVAVR